ncbi:hypothetical protein ACFL4J_01900, partial [Candidatus Margulisiibacteriota bacterium]
QCGVIKMLEGIFGANQSIQANAKASKPASQTSFSSAEFRNAMVEVARSANMAIADKGTKDQTGFNKWRDLDDNLYFNLEEEKEEAIMEHLKKLKKIFKQKFGG